MRIVDCRTYGVGAIEHAVWMEAVHGVLDRLPSHVQDSLAGIGLELHQSIPGDDAAVGWFRWQRDTIQLAVGRLKQYAPRLREAVIAHELAHAYAFRSPDLRHRWDDEEAIDGMVAAWGFPIREARRAVVQPA